MTAAPRPPRRLAVARTPVTGRERVLIGVVWAAYAVLSAASRLFDHASTGRAPVAGVLAVAIAESLGWALLTPPILALAGRLVDDPRSARRVLAVVVAGLAIAAVVGWLGTELRRALTPFGGGPPRPDGPFDGAGVPGAGFGTRARPGSPRGGGPPVWFGVLNALVFYLATLAAGVARAYSRRDHARREEAARREALLQAQLAEARLESLQRQLDPHFLFNTLNAVSALVERDPRGVRRMIARLSELLRHSFERGGEAEVPLRDELALLGRYVDIMRVRFQGRLAFDVRAPDATLDALVPSMVLQPLVENAIKHGVERAPGPGRVVVDAEVDAGALVLRVSDDGPGPPAGDPEAVGADAVGPAAAARRPGVGLRNTMARLEQLYGPAQRLTLRAGALGGAVAEVRLPFHERPRAAALGDHGGAHPGAGAQGGDLGLPPVAARARGGAHVG